MGLSTVLIGLTPTYASIGIWSPILLTLLRLLRDSRWAANGAAACCWPWTSGLSALFSEEAFLSYGWRIPFVLSIVLVLIGMWIRNKVEETPSFRKVAAKPGTIPRMPGAQDAAGGDADPALARRADRHRRQVRRDQHLLLSSPPSRSRIWWAWLSARPGAERGAGRRADRRAGDAVLRRLVGPYWSQEGVRVGHGGDRHLRAAVLLAAQPGFGADRDGRRGAGFFHHLVHLRLRAGHVRRELSAERALYRRFARLSGGRGAGRRADAADRHRPAGPL